MADTHGTDSGVTGMRNYLHIFIKSGLVPISFPCIKKTVPICNTIISQMTAISSAISSTKPPPLWQWKKSVL